jgi:hypothetical protein
LAWPQKCCWLDPVTRTGVVETTKWRRVLLSDDADSSGSYKEAQNDQNNSVADVSLHHRYDSGDDQNYCGDPQDSKHAFLSGVGTNCSHNPLFPEMVVT